MGVELRKTTESNNDFKHDLKLGQLGEDVLSKLLSQKTLEVKTDFFTEITGNIAIEFESRGKKSGIATTEADYWAFVLVKNTFIIIIETEKLRDIARREYRKGNIVKGGDNLSSKLILIKVKELLDHVIEVTIN